MKRFISTGTLAALMLMAGWYMYAPQSAWYLPGSYSGGLGYQDSYQNQYQNSYGNYAPQNYGGGYGGYGGYQNAMPASVYTSVAPYVQLGSYGNIGGYYGGSSYYGQSGMGGWY